MPNFVPNSTNYEHSNEPNLVNLHKSMQYNAVGQPVVRVGLDSTLGDAFGRLRTSNPFTIFDSTLRYSDDTRNWDTSLSNNASITHLPYESSIAMNVSTTVGDRAIRQTKRVFLYQPGKSQLSINTFVFNEGKTGLSQKVGVFDNDNGIYIEREGTTTYLVKRSSITGSVVNTRVAQNNWNGDVLDGTGNSRIVLDWTKVQIFWADIEWLGAGSVRVGFVIDGQFILAHSFHHANTIDSVYMTTATLPVRYEIENISSTVSNSRLKHICNTVISEGGYTPKTLTRSISTPLTGVNLSNNVFTPVIAIRLKSTRISGVATPIDIDLYGLQNAAYRYAILNDVTLAGGVWVSSGTESNVEYNITATSYTGGSNLLEGIFVGGAYGGATNIDLQETNGAYQLRKKINNTSEVFLLAVRSTTNNDDTVASLSWSEHN